MRPSCGIMAQKNGVITHKWPAYDVSSPLAARSPDDITPRRPTQADVTGGNRTRRGARSDRLLLPGQTDRQAAQLGGNLGRERDVTFLCDDVSAVCMGSSCAPGGMGIGVGTAGRV